MSEFRVVDGKIVELVEQEVVEDLIEANLQEELDQAQNELNTQTTNLANAEMQYLEAEANAEAASTLLEEAKAAKDVAEAKVSKSVSRRDSWAQAIELRQEQLGTEASEDNDGVTEASTEAVDIPITVAPAEG